MCPVDAYDNFHPPCYDYASSGGVIPLPDGPTIDSLKSICNTFKFIDILLQTFDRNYVLH